MDDDTGDDDVDVNDDDDDDDDVDDDDNDTDDVGDDLDHGLHQWEGVQVEIWLPAHTPDHRH